MKFEKHFIDSLGYEIELTSRICHELFKRWFEKNTDLLTIDEFIILDTIDCEHKLSQIELAHMTLKGKAHTGKFLDTLEEKGFITRLYDTKNSRMVKIPIMTKFGKQIYDEIRLKLEESTNKIYEFINENEMKNIKKSIKNFREKILEFDDISFN